MLEVLENAQTSFSEITLSVSEYKKDRVNSHEVSVDGKMFDVKSVNIAGDSVVLCVISDTREDNILRRIKELLSGSKQSKNNTPHQLRPIHALKYITPEAEDRICFEFPSVSILLSLVVTPISSDEEIPTPPPKQA